MTRVGVVSDVHLGFGDDEAVLADLEGVVDRLADGFGADRLLVLGDLLQEESPTADAGRIERLRGVLERPGVPVTYVRGNHDVGNLSNGALTALLGDPPCSTLDTGTGRLVYLNSAAPHLGGARGEVGTDGRDYLERTLEAGPAAVCFLHHPLCLPDLSENPWFADYPERAVCGDRRETVDVLRGSGVDVVVSGHVHEPHHVESGQLEHVVLGPFNRATPEGGRPATHAELTVETDGIEFVERASGTVQRRLTVER